MADEVDKKPIEEAKPELEVKAESAKSDSKEVNAADSLGDTLHVKLYSPFQVYFDDEATSISAENDTGPFDVLAKHHNFITLLNPCEINIKSTKGDKRIKIARGVMHIRQNRVTVFLDV